jgi:hypothetical protein
MRQQPPQRRSPLPFVRQGPARHLGPPGPAASAPAPPKPADESAERARKLLSIPARHEQIRRVKLYDGEVGIRVLDDLSVVEAHQKARQTVEATGFDTEPTPGTMSWVEYTVALAAELCARAVVHPETGFPLWDNSKAMRGDLTREDIEFLDGQRDAFARDVAPRPDQLDDAELKRLLEVAIGSPKADSGSTEPWLRWPRSMLLDSLRYTVGQLRERTGSTS